MEKIIFINSRGDQIIIKGGEPYTLQNLAGIEATVPILLAAKGFRQNGASYIDTILEPRTITFEILIKGTSEEDTKNKKREVLNIFNSTLKEGWIIYTNDIGSWKIAATVFDGPYELEKTRNPYYKRMAVGLYCAKPDWLSLASTQMKMIDLVGGLTLPFTLPFILAERGTGGIVDYTGDNPARLLFDFRVVSGGTSMSNPKVTNQNGDYIQITKTLTAGQKILVDTNPDAPSIIFEDTDGSQSDAWDTLVYGSTFFQLELGTNTFSFTATAGDPEVYITYNEQYAGV